MRKSTILICLLLFPPYMRSQIQTISFDVASVKPAPPPDRARQNTGGPGTSDPGRIQYSSINLKILTMMAYNVQDYQVIGPDWLDYQMFQISATMPPDTTQDQFRLMLRDLLAERFHLTVHRESKEMPVYSLGVSRDGPKMKLSDSTPQDSAAQASWPPAPSIEYDADGFPIVKIPPGKTWFSHTQKGMRVLARANTMHDFADKLVHTLGRPVKDETALTAKYNFVLTCSNEGTIFNHGRRSDQPEADAFDNIFTAVRKQLGLRLDSKKAVVDVIVVDSALRTPVAN